MNDILRKVRPADVAAVIAPLVVGGIGGIATSRSIPGWYRGLRKPAWNPPDEVFGPVWTMLYVMMGVALALARRADPASADRRTAVWGLQLALNLAWSLAFFGRRDTRAGLAVIVMLWVSIVATIVELSRADRISGALLLPYLAWVTFATALNAEIVRLNG